MREFLRGWKRKVGVATLGLACVLTAIWVETARHGTEIIVAAFGRAHSIGWERERVSWWTWRLRPPFEFVVHWNSWSRFGDNDWPYRQAISDQRDMDFEKERWRRRAARSNVIEEFRFHRVYWGMPRDIGHPAEQHGLVVREAPCWSLVVPLTVLSAWLLLSKPRAAKANPAGAN